LKFLPLGVEYNLIQLGMLDNWNPSAGAIRILHIRDLHKGPPGDPLQPFDLVESIGPRRARIVELSQLTEEADGAVRLHLADAVEQQLYPRAGTHKQTCC
jgi:hypothetical protein